MRSLTTTLFSTLLVATVLAACGSSASSTPAPTKAATPPAPDDYNPQLYDDRNVYIGAIQPVNAALFDLSNVTPAPPTGTALTQSLVPLVLALQGCEKALRNHTWQSWAKVDIDALTVETHKLYASMNAGLKASQFPVSGYKEINLWRQAKGQASRTMGVPF